MASYLVAITERTDPNFVISTDLLLFAWKVGVFWAV
jgi:hypothetical protein